MTLVGETLQKARESQGRSLADFAGELCITRDYLAAIERGDVGSLPGLFFFKSFARQYAVLLGLDAELIRQRMDAVALPEAPSPRTEIRRLDPLVEMTNRRFVPDIPMSWSVAALGAVLLLCSGFYSWWVRVPQARVEPASLPAARKVAVATRVATTQPIANVLPTVPVANTQAGTVNGIVLNLSATERTWLSISSGGKEVFSGFLLPSESKVLSGLDIATMRVGNAAGIDVRWNGKLIGPLGTRGQVLTIRFTPEDFEIVPYKEQPKQEL